jgi:hypothetical protein
MALIGRAGGLLALTELFLSLALWRFNRRHIAAGAREWRFDPRTFPASLRRPVRRMEAHGGQQAAR